MPLTTGPCRTGQYAVFYQKLFQELGYKNVCVLSLNSDNSYAELGGEFNKRAWWTVVLSDYMTDIQMALRALAVNPAEALAVHAAISDEMVEAAGRGVDALQEGLPRWGRRLGQLRLKKRLSRARKVLVVGEIFVRRDDYSVETLISHMVEREIVPKVTSLSEWIHYLDYDQVRKLRKSLSAMNGLRRLISPEARKLAWLKVEMMWKAWVEHRIVKELGVSELIAESPHGMERIMARSTDFTTPELESEASLSPAVAAVASEEGYDGVAIIAPFACLPGRLIEALFAPWARARRLPVISLENDGNPYPPNVVSRIEIFAHNVSRGIRELSAAPVAAGGCGAESIGCGCSCSGCGETKPRAQVN